MKRLLFSIVGATALSISQLIAAGVPSGGALEITEAPVNVLLDIYTHVSGLDLVTASNVTQMSSKVVVLPERHGQDWSRGKLLSVIEKALLDQRGIVITRLDDKRASVTYNDALKFMPVKEKLTLPALKIPLEKP